MSPPDPFELLLEASRAAGYRAAELRARVAAMPPAPPVESMPLVKHFTKAAMQAAGIGALRASRADGEAVLEEAGRRYEFASGGRVSVSEVET